VSKRESVRVDRPAWHKTLCSIHPKPCRAKPPPAAVCLSGQFGWRYTPETPRSRGAVDPRIRQPVKLIRWGAPGAELPGLLLDGVRKDCSAHASDWTPAFFRDRGMARLDALVASGVVLPDVPDEARWAACIPRPGKLVGIGLNYSDHAAEVGARVPREPIIFLKATNTVVGPYDDVLIPRHSVKTDWEVELAIIIGKRASYVDLDEAMDYVAGYALHNDYSERAWQLERGGQWMKGKSADTFAPLGPYLVTKDEVPEPNALPLWLTVNGKRLQDSNTDDMIFDVPTLVSYISQFMTLLPGDVISTGTPAGVGLGLKPPRYLQPGDVVELGIEGLGQQRQLAVSYQ